MYAADTRQPLTNSEISSIFDDIARLLGFKKDNIFKIKAYQKVARSILDLTEPLENLVKENRINEISGAGEAISKKITELVQTGRLEYYEKLKKEISESPHVPGR